MSVTVIRVEGSTVRLGISAPSEVAVHREELWREILAEGSDAAEAETTSDLQDAFAAELSDSAYQVALRNGLADSWIDLELGLWRAVATTVKNWSRRFTHPRPKPEPQAPDAEPARLP